MTFRRIGLLTLIVAGLVVAGFGAYFAYLDDAQATTQATILGALAQIVGVVVAAAGAWLTVRTSSPRAPSPPSVHVEQKFASAQVRDSTVIGNVGTYSAGRDERTTR